MKTNTEILEEAFELMPNEFTSRQFSKAATRRGLNKKLTRSGILAVFLHEVALQTYSNKQWIKKLKNQVNENNKITDAIALLKSNGYKIMKPVTNFEEV